MRVVKSDSDAVLKTYTASLLDSSTEAAAWTKGKTGIVKLPDDDRNVFANYLPVLYSGSAPVCQESHKVTLDNDIEDAKKQADRKYKAAMCKAFASI